MHKKFSEGVLMYDMLQLVVKAAKIQRAKSRVEFRAIIPTS